MKNYFKRILFSVVLSAVLFSCSSAPVIPVERLDSLLNKAISMNLFSGNILIADDKVIAYEKSFGKADYEKNIANTSETKFQLASITKDFTKVMILQLIEQHKLSATDNIGKYLPGFSDEVNQVTVQQLLNFTSGLGDYHNTQDFEQLQGSTITIPDIIPIIQKEKLQFKPGSQFFYSNSGYVVLAALIEKITNRNYYQDLEEMILEKLNMNNTSFNGYAKPMPGIATGYLTNQIGPLQNNSEWHLAGAGDAGIYTTTHDLLAFITSVFYDNKLLTDSSKLKYVSEMMRESKIKTWNDFQKNGRYSPAGGAPGVSTMFTVNMQTGNIAIILSNYDEGTAEEIGIRISAILNNKPVQPLKEPAPKYLFNLIKTKGGKYFEENYKQEIKNSGMREKDDMMLLNAGQALLQEKDYDNAISLYRVYTKEFPKIIIAWNDMGEAYLDKGDKENALKCFEQALKIMPDNKRAKNNLEHLK